MKPAILAISAAALALAACVETGPPLPPNPGPVGPLPPSVAASDAAAIDIAERVCEISSLREERDSRIEIARSLVYGYQGEPDSTYEADERRLTQMPPAAPQSELTGLLRTFEFDLDAAYRFAAQSCRSYAMCMQVRGYDEGACSATRATWDSAQQRFMDASQGLGELRAAMVEDATPSRRPAGPSAQTDTCRSSIGSIFSARTCN
ncbi:MAG: hypothetical protein ABL308_12190 [Oceanicaulis sp.]